MTYEEMDALLKVALKLSEKSVKQIAAESGIHADTLYIWKTMDRHLMPQNVDVLFSYLELMKKSMVTLQYHCRIYDLVRVCYG
jgi:hypothetical protein